MPAGVARRDDARHASTAQPSDAHGLDLVSLGITGAARYVHGLRLQWQENRHNRLI